MEIPENNNVVEIIVGGDRRSIDIKEYKGQRVVFFRDIDEMHNKSEGSARRNFYNNKDRFIVSKHYYHITKNDNRGHAAFHPLLDGANELYLITMTGYLMLTKTFSDDLSWQIQQELVDNYFSPKKSEQFKDEYLQLASNLYNSPNLLSLGKGAQKEIGKAIANAVKLSGRENRKQKSITSPATPKTGPTPSDLLNELLSHAVPLITFTPRGETELKSSVLYDEKLFYIFPFAAERYLEYQEAKKYIYPEIKFLCGKSKVKRFNFFGKENKPYHIWILPRRAVVKMDNIIAFPG